MTNSENLLQVKPSQTGEDEGSNSTLAPSASKIQDPGALLMKFAGKSKKDSNNVERKHSKESKNSKQRRHSNKDKDAKKPVKPVVSSTLARKPSAGESIASSNDVPDGYDDLDEENLATFRELFNLLDQSNTGIITADNLYEELRRVDSDITYSEVEEVLKKVDKDGNGTIDFDEFLFHMTQMGEEDSMGDEEHMRRRSRRQRLLCSAITQFSLKQTLADIERTWRIRQAPHVLSHYTAGARLIGLTTRQLERMFKKMQKSASKNDSPYAKPLTFVHRERQKIVSRKPVASTDMSNEVVTTGLRETLPVGEAPSDSVTNLSQEIQQSLKLFSQRGSNANKLPDAQLLMELKQKIVSAQLKVGTEGKQEGAPGPAADKENQPVEPTPVWKQKPQIGARKRIFSRQGTSANKVEPRKRGVSHSWTTPRIEYFRVPIPKLRLSKKQTPTFANLAIIRKKAAMATDDYYHILRQKEISNSWEHWERLYIDIIRPKKLLENFRTVFRAYSPHRESEAFVVCPWKPGPFIYIRHGHQNGQPRRPDNGIGYRSPSPSLYGHCETPVSPTKLKRCDVRKTKSAHPAHLRQEESVRSHSSLSNY